MESSKIFGDHGGEECQSSESGWTMYIGSPVDEYDDDHHHKEDVDSHGMKKKKKKGVYVDEDDEYDGSDDSMASDASSGPASHYLHDQTQPWEAHKDAEKVKKQVKKKNRKNKKSVCEARNEPNEECLVDEKRGIVTVQSGNRAWFLRGQRK